MRRQGLAFWALLLPMTWGAWELIGLGGAALLDTILLTGAAMGAMVTGRMYWWFRQRSARRAARFRFLRGPSQACPSHQSKDAAWPPGAYARAPQLAILHRLRAPPTSFAHPCHLEAK